MCKPYPTIYGGIKWLDKIERPVYVTVDCSITDNEVLLVPKLLTTLALIILLNCCCSKEEPTSSPEPDISALIPLEIGNVWQYVDTLFGQPPRVSAVTESVDVVQELYGQTWYRTQQKAVSGGVTYSIEYLSCNRADGYYWLPLSNGDTVPRLLWKYPAEIGDTFNFQFNARTIVKSTNAVITSPAGTFSCYLYAWEYAPGMLRSDSTWIAPGVGMVKYMSVDSTTITSVQLLTAYQHQ